LFTAQAMTANIPAYSETRTYMTTPPDSDLESSLSYRSAGVDIDAGNRLVERIKPVANSTLRPEVLAGLGGFGALFELPLDRYLKPVLVSSTDGVGTKLKLAQRLQQHQTVGIDLVAMCANDVLVQGAEPLYFLDYYATGKLNVDVATEVIEGIAEGCRQAGAALIGGESAEMPGMYANGEYDLAGFCVGIVEKNRILDSTRVRTGDLLLGVASSGPHSNGYSLIRKILDRGGVNLEQRFGDSTLGNVLLAPTQIYVKLLQPMLMTGQIHALAHITGGGLTENLPRALPRDCMARVKIDSWPRPKIFEWLKSQGRLKEEEMLRTFNCGIGMVIVISKTQIEAALTHCKQHEINAWIIGDIHASQSAPFVQFV